MKLKNLLYRGLVFEADKGTGGNPVTPPAVAEKTDKGDEEKTIPISRFNEVNNELKKLRDDLKARNDADEAAKQQALKDQAQWKTLAEQNESKVKELEPQVDSLTKEAKKYQEAVKAQLKAQLEKVPEMVRTLLERMDPVEQLEWIAANQDKLGTVQPVKGVPATPKPNGQLGDEQKKQLQAEQAKMVRSKF